MDLLHNLKIGATSWRAARRDGLRGVWQRHLGRKQGAYYLNVRVGKSMARQSHVEQGQRHGKIRRGNAGQAMVIDAGRFDQVGGGLAKMDSSGNERVWQSRRAASCGSGIGAKLCRRQGLAQCQPWHKEMGEISAVHKQLWKKHVPSTWGAVGGYNLSPKHADHGLKWLPHFCTCPKLNAHQLELVNWL